MTLSMTGFGKASGVYKSKSYSLDIKALNAKNSDVRVKVPLYLKDKEIEIRNMVIEQGIRGKFDLNLSVISTDDSEYKINSILFRKYFTELSALCSSVGMASSNDLISSILRIPNVIYNDDTSVDDKEWQLVAQMIQQAMGQLCEYRAIEGLALHNDLLTNVLSIDNKLKTAIEFQQERVEKIRQKLIKSLNELNLSEGFDSNRLEQELIFYMERLDINEEIVRLGQHCKFFKEELESKSREKGRKLSFITQEMGREINTLGSKAQHSTIQRNVVMMKEDLEKIREQLANIL